LARRTTAAAERPPFKIVGPELLLALAESRRSRRWETWSRPVRDRHGVDVVFDASTRKPAFPEVALPGRMLGRWPKNEKAQHLCEAFTFPVACTEIERLARPLECDYGSA
jgi:hypothetical protein